MGRLLHLIDTGGPGGAETVLRNLVREVAREGWESRIILPRSDWLHEQLVDIGADTVVLPSRGSADLRFLLELTKEIRAFVPDLIHAHLLFSGVYGTMASTLAGHPPLVCTFHGAPDVPSTDRYLPLKARVLSRSRNRIVYVSHDLRKRLEVRLGTPENLGRVIHNGVRFSAPGDPEVERLALGLASGQRLVGAVGNLREAKDYPNLLRAARLVCDRLPDVHFAVVGDHRGDLWEKIRGLRADLGMGSRVQFLGFRDDVASFVNALDLFVSSSSSEGLPLAPVEAMGMGKPVVLTRCGGVPEAVTDWETGLLVPPEDPESLAAAICYLLETPHVAAELGARAREAVRQRFSLQRMVGEYTCLYGELISAYGRFHA
jgi:glycosyltransferase involved in cell wall biosynthesis